MNKIAYTVLSIALTFMLLPSCNRQPSAVENPYFSMTSPSGENIATLSVGKGCSLDLKMNQYASVATGQVLSCGLFVIDSNLDWRVIPEGDAKDWIRAFPDEGSAEGAFTFLLSTNESYDQARTASFRVVVFDSVNEYPIPGTITVNQNHQPGTLTLSTRAILADLSGGTFKISVKSNVSWTYDIQAAPGTESVDWITDLSSHDSDQTNDDISIRIAPNDGAARGAIITVTGSDPSLSSTVSISQKGVSIEKWEIVWYEALNGTTSDKEKFAEHVWTPEGSGVSSVVYSAAAPVYNRTSTKQGTSSYYDYTNALIDGRKATPGGCIFVPAGSPDDTWVQVSKIGVSGLTKLQYGMGLFIPLKTAQSAVDANPITVSWRCNEETDWRLWGVIAGLGENWYFYTVPEIQLPAGAETIDVRLTYPGQINVRYDDMTIVGVRAE